MISEVPRVLTVRRCRICRVAEVFSTERLWVFDDLCHPCAIRLLERALRPDPAELLALGRDPEGA